MKTRIKKIMIVVAALLFLGSGVSFAHDWNRGHHKPRSYGHDYYKNGYDDNYGWHNRRHKPPRHTYRHNKKWHGNHRRWHKKQHKRWHNNRDRHHYRKGNRVQHNYHHGYDHRAPHEGNVLGFKLKEPGFKFAVVVKEHR